jgi:hypothetical protein
MCSKFDGTAMSGRPSERLSDTRAVSLVVRVLVDQHGQIISGEVGALGADEHRQRWIRFRGSGGLLEAVQATLAAIPDTHNTTG